MATTDTTVLDQLSERFPPDQVRQRKGSGGKMLSFIGIDQVILRLNKVLGLDWDFVITKQDVQAGAVTVVADLTIYPEGRNAPGITRSGSGGSNDKDADNAAKIAQAEALKKAANLFGVALYLWDEVELAMIELLASGSVDALKSELAERAVASGKITLTIPPDPAENAKRIAAHFNVPTQDLGDRDTLVRLLQEMI